MAERKFVDAVADAFMHRVSVLSVTVLSEHFRLLVLQAEAFKHTVFEPGQKVQLRVANWSMRTYTPMRWNQSEGHVELLAFVHGDGPGAQWVREVRVGDSLNVFGPRGSLALAKVQKPIALFGDETSFAVATALLTANPQTKGSRFIFEVRSLSEATQVLTQVGLADAHLVQKSDADAHLAEVESLLAATTDRQYVFTGCAKSTQRLRQGLKARGVSLSGSLSKAYWAEGKVGLD